MAAKNTIIVKAAFELYSLHVCEKRSKNDTCLSLSYLAKLSDSKNSFFMVSTSSALSASSTALNTFFTLSNY